MNVKIVLMALLVVGIFITGCSQNSDYSAYTQQGQAAPTGQYVGGGCGVAPAADYENTPVDALTAADSAL